MEKLECDLLGDFQTLWLLVHHKNAQKAYALITVKKLASLTLC